MCGYIVAFKDSGNAKTQDLLTRSVTPSTSTTDWIDYFEKRRYG